MLQLPLQEITDETAITRARFHSPVLPAPSARIIAIQPSNRPTIVTPVSSLQANYSTPSTIPQCNKQRDQPGRHGATGRTAMQFYCSFMTTLGHSLRGGCFTAQYLMTSLSPGRSNWLVSHGTTLMVSNIRVAWLPAPVRYHTLSPG